MFEKDLTLSFLLDQYGSVLGERHRVLLDYYYNQDLSLGEIAQELGVSRQAVNDNLTRTEVLLRRMEENIGSVKRDMDIRRAVQEILDAASVLDTSSDPAVLDAMRRITAAVHTLKE